MSLRDNLKARTFVGETFAAKVPKYGYYYDDKTHERVFGQIGVVDRQADVQSELATCDYSLLMASLTSSLDDFSYTDFVDSLPSFDISDPLAIVAAREQCEIAFKSLPKEVKAKYANNPRQFAAAIANGNFGVDIADWAPKSVTKQDQQDTTGAPAAAQADMLAQLDELKRQLADLRGAGDAAPGTDSGAGRENQGGQK